MKVWWLTPIGTKFKLFSTVLLNLAKNYLTKSDQIKYGSTQISLFGSKTSFSSISDNPKIKCKIECILFVSLNPQTDDNTDARFIFYKGTSDKTLLSPSTSGTVHYTGSFLKNQPLCVAQIEVLFAQNPFVQYQVIAQIPPFF